MTQLNHGSISTARRFIACPAACADIALSASTMSSTRCSILCWCRCRHMRGRQCQTSPSSGRAPRTHGVSADKRTRTEQQGRSWQRQRHVTPAVSRSYPLCICSVSLSVKIVVASSIWSSHQPWDNGWDDGEIRQ